MVVFYVFRAKFVFFSFFLSIKHRSVYNKLDVCLHIDVNFVNCHRNDVNQILQIVNIFVILVCTHKYEALKLTCFELIGK